MDRCHVNKLGTAESRWSGKGHFSTDDHTIYYSGNEKGGSNDVAFITKSFIFKHVLGHNPVRDRIISIKIQAQPINLLIIQVYAPTSTASDNDLGYIYNQLQDILDDIPQRDIIVMTGDFNAEQSVKVCNMKMKPWQSVRMAWEVGMREVVYLSTSA